MTMRSFGNVVPIHIDMLRLAGYSVHWGERDIRLANSDEDCLAEMRDGRVGLREATGQDFGYDLAAWRTYLLTAPADKHGYRHPYAFRGVDSAVERAIENDRRSRLVAQLASEAGADL